MSDGPTITDAPPEDVAAEWEALREALDARIPARNVDRNLLIATWNLRHFGDLTEKWRVGEDDSPRRNLRALLFIGEVVSRFDVVAIQEAKANLKALRHLVEWLGDNWGMILTDENRGPAGNNERLAFIYDRRRVDPPGSPGRW